MDFNLIKAVQQKYLKNNLPEVRIGDKIVVSFRIKEGTKERVQNFEGIVIAMRGQGTARMIKVRKIASGSIGVERTFPVNTPTVAGIKIIKRGRVRRAKLFYLRDRIGKKATKIKEGKMKEGEALLWEAVANTDSTDNAEDSTGEAVKLENESVKSEAESVESAVEQSVEESKNESAESATEKSVKSEVESAEPVAEPHDASESKDMQGKEEKTEKEGENEAK